MRVARGQLLDFAQRPIGEGRACRLAAHAVSAIVRQMRAHFVIDDPSRAAEFAQRIEVAERRQIGIGGIVLAADWRARPHRPATSAAPAGRRASVRAPARRRRDRVAMGFPYRPRRRRNSSRLDAGRREDRRLLPTEEVADLRLRPAHRRGRRHDLRSAPFPVDHARGQQVEGRLIETCDRAERARDEMQLVLDDQVDRAQFGLQPRAAARLRRARLGRIQRLFAAVYASAAQAIDYGVLPWGKRSMLSAIRACMIDAMQQLIANSGSDAESDRGGAQSNQSILAEFKQRFDNASFLPGLSEIGGRKSSPWLD